VTSAIGFLDGSDMTRSTPLDTTGFFRRREVSPSRWL
jgi:hypothetical protein